jgi:hypothetical protein
VNAFYHLASYTAYIHIINGQHQSHHGEATGTGTDPGISGISGSGSGFGLFSPNVPRPACLLESYRTMHEWIE